LNAASLASKASTGLRHHRVVLRLGRGFSAEFGNFDNATVARIKSDAEPAPIQPLRFIAPAREQTALETDGCFHNFPLVGMSG
jgi:hypothetical protein